MNTKNLQLAILMLTLSLSAFGQNMNPYEIFGTVVDTTYTPYFTPAKPKTENLVFLYNTDTTAEVQTLAFDFVNGEIKLYNAGNELFQTLSFEKGEVAFISTDPHWYNYPSSSPYAYCGNNPIMRIDPTGMDDFPVDENGNFKRDQNGNVQVIKTDLPHRLAVDTKGADGTITQKYYTLADQQNDKADIENNIITKVVMVNKGEMKEMLKKGGAFENKNANISYMKKESPDRGKLDFMYEIMPEVLDKKLPTPREGTLYIPAGDTYAHNEYNFGNFMWGAAGYTLGFAEWKLKAAAHIFTRIKEGEWDSADDQLSISRGVQSAKQNNYRNLRR